MEQSTIHAPSYNSTRFAHAPKRSYSTLNRILIDTKRLIELSLFVHE
uniref:Uncharacterized protein n=1 Tax=Triticum urartu TaxID=4572 RepID=A0A8R7TEW8_TRIUA